MEKYSPPNKQIPIAKRRCHRCYGSGDAPCPICGGTGEVVQGKDKFGKMKYGRCGGCFGTKTRRCAYCNGEGMV